MQELNFTGLLKKGVFYRDDFGNLLMDFKILKETDINLYDEFTKSPKLFINELKSESKTLFNISSFKIINYDNLTPLSELRVCNLNEICYVKGMITKSTKVVAYVNSTRWECNRCGAIIVKEGDEPPIGCSCRNKRDFNVSSVNYQDLQEIEIEEPQDELEGKQPHKIRVRLFDELTDKDMSGVLQPGNKVAVLGITEKTEVDNKNKKKKEETIFEYRILALSIESLEEQFNEEILTSEEERQIIEISSDNPLDTLSKSLAPPVFGYEIIKKALVLQMVGGVKKDRSEKIKSRERTNILLLGDPGVAKTLIGKCVLERMPKSVYISGDATTKAGLIGIVDKDTLLNAWCVRAGSLSKANDSIVVIDELDKLKPEDRESLHTPMESGEIVLNKADVHLRLNANCSVLGIANPKNGIFNLNEPVVSQIDIPPALMTRFDITFIMKDELNKEYDYSVMDSIYTNKKQESLLSIKFFRKYITYVKKLKPSLPEEHLSYLQDLYHSIRAKAKSISGMRGIPISARFGEGVIRLAEASAKLRLSEKVEMQDIIIAKDILLDSLNKLGVDTETGEYDLGRMGFGKPLNKKMKARLIIEILRDELKKFKTDYVYDKNLKEKCLEKGISNLEYEELIFELNNEGEILKVKGGWGLHGM